MADVSGAVTYKGKPVTFGRVTFIDVQGRPGFGDLASDGRYQLKAPVGECKVAITSREVEPPADSKATKQVRPGMYIGKTFIPEKYESHIESGLTFKVEAGVNKANFDLE
jgi:hypothetical protein